MACNSVTNKNLFIIKELCIYFELNSIQYKAVLYGYY